MASVLIVDDEEVFVRTRALVEACKTAFGK
jgi:hypothetical protein